MLIGREATGVLWEPLDDALTQAGDTVLVRNPRQTASWATSLGLRAKTDEADALTLARGLLAGLARASTLPSESIRALRVLTRARRDLIQARTAARQRVHDELAVVFPEFPRLLVALPGRADLGCPNVLQVLSTYSSAQHLARADPSALRMTVEAASAGRWSQPEGGDHAAWSLDALAGAAQAGGMRLGRRQVRRILCTEGVRWRRTPSCGQRTAQGAQGAQGAQRAHGAHGAQGAQGARRAPADQGAQG